jgi:hypothetical protein
MTRKDSEKESERPHYYSQFWLDVAAGRRIIGAPKPNEEADIESEAEPEPVALRRTARASSPASSDGYAETLAHPEVEPEFDADDFAEPEPDELDVNDEFDEAELPLADVDEAEIPDVDFAAPEIEEEELFDEEEEEEEDLDWTAGRGRKKPKPGRQVKPPKKAPKRETRRGF